jgi:hypothetical protein
VTDRFEFKNLNPLAKFVLAAVGGVWLLLVMGTFFLIRCDATATIWQALGGSCLIGGVIGTIGAGIIASNWDDMGLP